jgi:nicotinamidase-related amidase
MRDALLVIDMQAGMLDGPSKLDLAQVIQRINQLSALIRRRNGMVVWVQHNGLPGDSFSPDGLGWQLLPGLDCRPDDARVQKRLNDAYAETNLAALLKDARIERVFVTGWATDFCVDAAVRSSVSRGFHVVAVSDGHTVADRPHLSAAGVIAYHNWLWANLIPSRSVNVVNTAEVLAAEPT